MLAPGERDAVRGDLAERGATGAKAVGDVLGLVVRRQAALWKDWRPWVALVALAIPLSALLTLYSRRLADASAIYIWLYANNWDWSLPAIPAYRHELAGYFGMVLLANLTLPCWSWNTGVALGFLSRRAIAVTGALFCVMLPIGLFGPLGVFGHSLTFTTGRDFQANAAVFAVAFYRVAFPAIVQAVLVLLPAIAGMRQGLHWTALRPPWRALLWTSTMLNILSISSLLWFPWLVRNAHVQPAFWDGPIRLVQLLLVFVYWPVAYLAVSAIRRRWPGRPVRAAILFLTLAGVATAADPATVRAALQPAGGRKPAPDFALKDRSGKTLTLKKYRGKVVLLDFWATWCHGCKEEIPWFSEFQRKYAARGLTVVGVSLDDDGWKVVKPFLANAKLPYRVVLGDDPTAKKYGIESMPDTFLIDRHGRIAAAYAGLVDKDDVEANLRTMLSQR
jgi:peroxiredoxin